MMFELTVKIDGSTLEFFANPCGCAGWYRVWQVAEKFIRLLSMTGSCGSQHQRGCYGVDR